MTKPARSSTGLATALTALTFLAPVLVGIAALGTRTGVWTLDLGYDVLTRQVAFGLVFVGLLSALTVAFLALKGRGLIVHAVVALSVACLTLGAFLWQGARLQNGLVEDVSTDLAEIPGFGPLNDRRRGSPMGVTVGVESCPGAVTVPSQALPESVVYVLQNAGFAVERTGVAAVYATRRGFWFGFKHDVAVRIRPGQTDIRVAARDQRPQGGEACRLMTHISSALRQVD